MLIDDSIVRGTTSRKIVRMVREAGAREVHLRISLPAHHRPLLLRHRHAAQERADRGVAHRRRDPPLRRAPTASAYLSHEGLLQAAGDAPAGRHCTACFCGRYPVAVTQLDESQLRLFEKARA